jgi:lipopolysaccharide/colanic/teichoic acid biosynthesis glycosyltransferase
MPERQFAPEVNSIQPAYATITRDDLHIAPVDTRVGASVTVPQAPSMPDSRALHRQQERMIQRAYHRVEGSDAGVYDYPPSTAYRISKRVLDFSLAVPALIILAPLMLIVAAMIRLDSPGPALFKQQRVGQGGRLFCIYKFRSMTVNAGVRLGGIHKTEGDSRVTRVGRFIRKTSLDELPQLFNVILGQMSLVGPRPELPEIVLQRYEPWQYRRLSVPQGITGWWQVTGRGKKLLWKHTADDLYYVDRASFGFDIKLLVMTIAAVLGRDGAF